MNNIFYVMKTGNDRYGNVFYMHDIDGPVQYLTDASHFKHRKEALRALKAVNREYRKCNDHVYRLVKVRRWNAKIERAFIVEHLKKNLDHFKNLTVLNALIEEIDACLHRVSKRK